jgi:hypothetical protein
LALSPIHKPIGYALIPNDSDQEDGSADNEETSQSDNGKSHHFYNR